MSCILIRIIGFNLFRVICGDKSMAEHQIRNRHRLRKKAINEITNKLNNIFSTIFELKNSIIDSATLDDYEILIIDNQILGLIIDGEPFLTIRGLLKFRPDKRYVTVDMGAVKFISNGADVMAPGIVDADADIQIGDIIWVRDVNNLQPLAIGRAHMNGLEMVSKNSDKAVQVLHYIGDTLWKSN